MKTRLVKWLACPECLGDIRLEAIEQDRSAEVYTGLLLCDACRFIYPVYDGVPRMLPYFLDDYNKFIQNNRVVIEKNSGYSFPSGTVIKGEEATQRSFSKEWAECDYSGVLWNYTYEQLQQLFLWEIDMEPAKLKGKLIFDGGCGNGMFGDLISANGAEVVGMDLSSGVVSSYKKFINNGNVHFVQGTLFKPPLSQEFSISFIRTAPCTILTTPGRRSCRLRHCAKTAAAIMCGYTESTQVCFGCFIR